MPENRPRPRQREKKTREAVPVNRTVVIAAIVGVAVTALAIFFVMRATAPSGPLIVVDAGHGGEYSNTGVDGIRENDINLAIAKKLRKELTSRGYRVIMTRTSKKKVAEGLIPNWRWNGEAGRLWWFGDEKTPDESAALNRSDLQARVDIANEANADVFVSIHNNASKDPAMRGTETFAYRGDEPGKALATSVVEAIGARSGIPARGSAGSGLYVCRWTNMPAVLVEGAYFTNAEDAKQLKSGRFQQSLAEGIADGIDRWFVSYPLKPVEPQVTGVDAPALAAALSVAAYPKGAPVAVVMPSKSSVLGASAATLAAKNGAPLLLADDKALPPVTASELRRLAPNRVILVGVSKGIDLEALSAAITEATGSRASVETIAEANPQAAAASVAGWITVPASGEVAIVDAEDTVALTALAPYAARKLVPVLLASKGKLSDDGTVFLTSNRGRISRVITVGSEQAPETPEGWTVTEVREADPDKLAARLLASTDPAKAKRKLRPVALDPTTTLDVYTASAEAARRKQPVVQLAGGILGPYTREFLVNRTAKVRGFFIARDAESMPALSETALLKSVAR